MKNNEEKIKRLEASVICTCGLDVKNYLLFLAMMLPSIAVGCILGAFANGLVGISVFIALVVKDWLIMMIIQNKCDKK